MTEPTIHTVILSAGDASPESFIQLRDYPEGLLLTLGSRRANAAHVSWTVPDPEWCDRLAIALADEASRIRRERRDANQRTFPEAS